MGLTHAWAARSKAYFEAHKTEVPWHAEFGGKTQALFGIVQGGMYADLRRESAERLVEMNSFPATPSVGLAGRRTKRSYARDDRAHAGAAAQGHRAAYVSGCRLSR